MQRNTFPGDRLSNVRSPLLILLTAVGWATAWVVNNEYWSVLVALAGSMVAIRRFMPLLAEPVCIARQLQFGAFALVGILNLGFAVAWSISVFSLGEPLSDSLLLEHDISVGDYSRAVCFATLFAAVLSAIARLEILRAKENQLFAGLRGLLTISNQTLVVTLSATMAIEAWLIATGVIGYRSVNVQGTGDNTMVWFVPYLTFVQYMQVALTAAVGVRAFENRGGALRCFALISLASSLVLAFANGRADLVMTIGLYVLYWPLCATRKPRLGAMLMMGLAGSLIVVFLSSFNNFIRSTDSGVTDVRERGLSAVVREAGAVYSRESDAREAARERNLANLASRPLVAHPVAILQNQPDEIKRFGWGEEIFNSAIWVVPRVLFPAKVNYTANEEYLNKNFGVNLEDTADSLYLSAYVNFGWLGVLIQPFLLLLIWWAVLVMCETLRPPLLKFVIFSSWPPLFLIGIGESATFSWFLVLRTVGSIWVLFWIWDKLFAPGSGRTLRS